MEMPDGTIGHAELIYGDSLLFLSTLWKPAGFASPKDLAGIHSQIVCVVDDVDKHFAQARPAGAIVLNEPVDEPYGRVYRAMDPEGHRWMFHSATAS